MHGAAAEEVDVEVVNGLAAVARCVDDGAVAFGEIFLAGDFCGGGEELAEEWCVSGGGFSERCDVAARSDEDVRGRGGIDIGEGVAIIVLVDGSGGNGTVNDFAEETAHEKLLDSKK